MIAAGIGWSILPEICLSREDGLWKMPLQFNDGTPFTRTTTVYYQEDYALLPQVKLFLDRLESPA